MPLPLDPILEVSSDSESSLSFRDEALDRQQTFIRDCENGNFLESEVVETNRRTSEALLREVETNTGLDVLQTPGGADDASQLLNKELAGGQQRVDEVAEMGIDLLQVTLDSPVYHAYMKSRLALEEAKARPKLIPSEPTPTPTPPGPEPAPPRSRSKLVIGGIAFGLVIVGVVLLAFRKQIFTPSRGMRLVGSSSQRDAGVDDRVPDSVLEAEQKYLSLIMQAAADRPVNFADFGISNETYGQLRQAILMTRDNISEDSHWQMQANQAQLIYPPTQKPLTLGDHLLSLDFLIEMLLPLYPGQPFDLDVDQAISTLADTLDLKAENPMSTLYQSVMDVAPESSGINRLQRIVLVRSAIVRAVAQSVAP